MTEQNDNPGQNEIEASEDPQVAELVAYLDGELPDRDADRVEQLLQTDAQFRRSAETLDRTWQLLDQLGSVTASGEFTQKTLATISTISDHGDAAHKPANRWSFRNLLSGSTFARLLTWSIAGFLACSSGLLLSRKARHERTDPTDAKILRDLDLYLQYPKLWRIPDVEFLERASGITEQSAAGENP